MDTISYSHARTNFSKILDQVCQGHEAVIITRKQHPSAVLLSLADYDLLVEKTKQVSASPVAAKSEIKPAPDAPAVIALREGAEPSRSPRELSFNDYN